MTDDKSYFLCGIGGSGMLPLALILRGNGAQVSGSDRALDQGRTAAKFDFLREQGIALYPQDGSGIVSPHTIVVASAAVEDTVPDVKAARAIGATLITRAELLADLFNAAQMSIGVAGTSGKSTTTGMIGFILREAGWDPTIMNGAVMKDFVTPFVPFASAAVGKGGVFVSEVDESDGSIARYRPNIAVVNNIALDHKSMEELRRLFTDFVAKADTAVLNLDNAETAALLRSGAAKKALTFSLTDEAADFYAGNLLPTPAGIRLDVHEKATGARVRIVLQVPGRHNAANALAAIAAAREAGVSLPEAARALNMFTGIRRRLDVVGTAGGVTVIDDFAHNPDKITATLDTLHAFSGRLLVMFQPHGYGPLKLMKSAFIDCFAQNLGPDDVLVMPEPVYYGGTTDKAVSSSNIVSGVAAQGRNAFAFPDRPACGAKLLDLAQSGDRIVVMGARDDTLSQFAEELLASLAAASRA